MASNFDNSAGYYDRLSRLVYGRTLVDAQVYLLRHIPPRAKVLIAGGGTGWILEELARIHPSGLQITYVEISARMMALSEKRDVGTNFVTFVNQPIEDVSLSPDYDIVITPFLFDNFTEQTVNTVFSHIHKALRPNGLWLNADFQLTGKWWQNVLLKSMFLFFKVVCNIEASKLPNVASYFNSNGYSLKARQTFWQDFIVAEVYSR